MLQYTPATPADGVTSDLALAPGGTDGNAGFGCDVADYVGLNVTDRVSAFIKQILILSASSN